MSVNGLTASINGLAASVNGLTSSIDDLTLCKEFAFVNDLTIPFNFFAALSTI